MLFLRLQHGQIFLGLSADQNGFGFCAIEKSDAQFFGAGNHMKVGQYRAIVFDDDPSAYATLNLGIFVFGICGKSQNTDHCALNGSGCFAALRRYFFGLKRVQNGDYAKMFILEGRTGYPSMTARRRNMAEHSIEVVGAQLRAMMPWIAKNKLVDQTRN